MIKKTEINTLKMTGDFSTKIFSINYYDIDRNFLTIERTYNLKWENDINFKLFRLVSLDYSLVLTYDYDKLKDNYLIYDKLIAVEMSYFINR